MSKKPRDESRKPDEAGEAPNAVSSVVPAGLTRQREYTAALAKQKFDFSLVVADAFIRGIRDIGYKSTATALDELVDNSIQAGALNIHVATNFEGRADAGSALAVIDDGPGMDPDMIRASVIWGGTDREDDRTGFGRYGYGLPSSSLSQGKRFTVYAKTKDGAFNSVSLDVETISKSYSEAGGKIAVPPATPNELPKWVLGYIKEHFPGGVLKSGTVVIIEKLDRLTWKTTTGLRRNLLEHFGVVYRNFLRTHAISVDGEKVQVVDPLFTTPGARFFDLNESRAVPLEPAQFEVKSVETGASLGVVTVRFSYLPPDFAATTDGKRGNKNARFGVMKDHQGVIVMRQGRQLDVINRSPWMTFVNRDRYWGVEIDFPATMDEEFSVTTSKQAVGVSERMWELLDKAGVQRAIKELRSRIKREWAEKATEREQPEEKRASEQAMEDARKFKRPKPGSHTPEKEQRSAEAFRKAVRKRAVEQQKSEHQAEDELKDEARRHPFKVAMEAMPGAPFFRGEQQGGQFVLFLNTSHRFYTDLYAAPDATPRIRAGLEILLFVLGEAELDTSGERRTFYEGERVEWSTNLNAVLTKLEGIEDVPDSRTDEDEDGDGAPAEGERK